MECFRDKNRTTSLLQYLAGPSHPTTRKNANIFCTLVRSAKPLLKNCLNYQQLYHFALVQQLSRKFCTLPLLTTRGHESRSCIIMHHASMFAAVKLQLQHIPGSLAIRSMHGSAVCYKLEQIPLRALVKLHRSQNYLGQR